MSDHAFYSWTRDFSGLACISLMVCCWLGCLLPTQASAQNLVPNGSFEGRRQCPGGLGNLEEDCYAWTAPTRGSTDYFHACSEEMGTPENFNGRQEPFKGEGYAGFYAYAPNDYREYLQVALGSPLEAGREYLFSVALSLSERSDFSLVSLGVLFSSKPLKEDTRKVLSRKRRFAHSGHSYHLLTLTDPQALSQQEGWGRIQMRFTAKGTERYLIFGNFENDARTRRRPTGTVSNKGSYYYLDDVQLFASDGSAEVQALPEFQVDTLQTLQALLFEFDSYVLTETGKTQLQDLGAFMQHNDRLHLELRGHTDGMGSRGYNQRLSEARCKAVARYLNDSGVDGSRISLQGYGSELPVASNASPEGRLKNRRVEFILHSQKKERRPERRR